VTHWYKKTGRGWKSFSIPMRGFVVHPLNGPNIKVVLETTTPMHRPRCGRCIGMTRDAFVTMRMILTGILLCMPHYALQMLPSNDQRVRIIASTQRKTFQLQGASQPCSALTDLQGREQMKTCIRLRGGGLFSSSANAARLKEADEVKLLYRSMMEVFFIYFMSTAFTLTMKQTRVRKHTHSYLHTPTHRTLKLTHKHTQTLTRCLQSQKAATKHTEELEKALECSTCLNLLYQPITLLCGHSFCCACIKSWLRTLTAGNRICPMCRAPVGM